MNDARHRSGRSKLPRALALLAVASAGLAGTIFFTGQGGVAVASEHRPVFDDSFGGERGAGLDRSRWLLDGDERHGRQDGDGTLVVDRLISTRRAFAEPYGHAEARIKVRRAAGPWRAFGVVDKYGRVLRGNVETLDRDADPTSGRSFHTYTIDWTPRSVIWSVDGRPSLKLTPDEPGLPIALVLNLATDGRRPARMEVDFVKVTAGKKPMPAPTTPSAAPSSPPSSTPPAAPTTPPATSKPPAAPPATSKPPAAPKPAAWKAFTDYEAGDLVTYEGVTYQVKEAHTALPGWEPSALPNLFKKL
ncbi:family 16 glycosylhydrolase [Actinoplanes sp. LDG1-06]|uniref:Family 16 glycosylhydrolase n=1 Tax=Paractinoplanes ovalisporus TaxID=2810368 RepID=A0ABS2AMN2_9ACTN|nr:carbohydrate-binding protein [Actinoplanes ovalisporus]MBM2621117.1 family 16 glycosylhydrolase [Actinoplanes ovalisporus]